MAIGRGPFVDRIQCIYRLSNESLFPETDLRFDLEAIEPGLRQPWYFEEMIDEYNHVLRWEEEERCQGYSLMVRRRDRHCVGFDETAKCRDHNIPL